MKNIRYEEHHNNDYFMLTWKEIWATPLSSVLGKEALLSPNSKPVAALEQRKLKSYIAFEKKPCRMNKK